MFVETEAKDVERRGGAGRSGVGWGSSTGACRRRVASVQGTRTSPSPLGVGVGGDRARARPLARRVAGGSSAGEVGEVGSVLLCYWRQ